MFSEHFDFPRYMLIIIIIIIFIPYTITVSNIKVKQNKNIDIYNINKYFYTDLMTELKKL